MFGKKLSQRDKRALVLGAVCAVGIAAVVFGREFIGRYWEFRKSSQARMEQLRLICQIESKQAGLVSIVPVFELPQEEEKQKFLFREKVRAQLNKAGIKSEPLQLLAVEKPRRGGGNKVLRLQARRGKCNFGQALDFLAGLNENPYLVGIEEFKLKCDPKKRQEFEMDLTVSTFVK